MGLLMRRSGLARHGQGSLARRACNTSRLVVITARPPRAWHRTEQSVAKRPDPPCSLTDPPERQCQPNGYPNEIGPGVGDIHSPRVPSAEEMADLLYLATNRIPPGRLWVNPDCGPKTCGWAGVRPTIANLARRRGCCAARWRERGPRVLPMRCAGAAAGPCAAGVPGRRLPAANAGPDQRDCRIG
jgi:hypothetical protein